jgi:hypothetical protein
MNEAAILYEKGDYHIRRHTKGWLYVYRVSASGTHSERVATIDFRRDPEYQLARAKAEIDRRINLSKGDLP